MIFARNNVIIDSTSYDRATFIPGLTPATKITVINLSSNPVLLNIGEWVGEDTRPDWGDPTTSEIQIDGGFSSIVPEQPIQGWRFRLPNGGTRTTIHFRVYG